MVSAPSLPLDPPLLGSNLGLAGPLGLRGDRALCEYFTNKVENIRPRLAVGKKTNKKNKSNIAEFKTTVVASYADPDSYYES